MLMLLWNENWGHLGVSQQPPYPGLECLGLDITVGAKKSVRGVNVPHLHPCPHPHPHVTVVALGIILCFLGAEEEEEGPTDSRSSREGFAAELVSFLLFCAGSPLALFAFFFLLLNPVVFHGSRTAPVGALLAVQAK